MRCKRPAMPRTAPLKTTVFDRMSGLARDLGAINLGQGFPDAEHAPELLAAASRALAGKSNQYPPMRGLPELRQGVCDYYAKRQGLALDPAQVVVTSGATEALAASILACIGPGDEAIMLQPCYDAYVPLVERAGGLVCGEDNAEARLGFVAGAIPGRMVLAASLPGHPPVLGLSFDTQAALADDPGAAAVRVLQLSLDVDRKSVV